MVSAFNKFEDFVEQLAKGVHDWSSHTFKAAFTNVAPVATNAVLADITQISSGGGYTSGAGGGVPLSVAGVTETAGVSKVVIAEKVFTANGGSVGPFRYVVIYNDSATSPADALVCWFDYGSSITLSDGETFTIAFGPAGIFTIT